nr:MAG TPA_asm: hypothetical protein [Caudoviricetes sp.]
MTGARSSAFSGRFVSAVAAAQQVIRPPRHATIAPYTVLF